VSETIFTTEHPATTDDAGGGQSRTLGVVFRSSVEGTIDGIRWFGPTGAPNGTCSAHLFSMTNPNDLTGTLLASQTFGSITGGVFNNAIFAQPVAILPNQPYCAQIYTPDHYCYTGPGQFTTDFTNAAGHLAVYSSSSSNNGKFKNGASPTDFPSNAGGGGFNFFVDVIFSVKVQAPTPPPPGSQNMGWYGLLSILHEAKEQRREIEERPPMACPNDGEPLLQGPRGLLYCPFDGWRWPDDAVSRNPGQAT
jgi:Domain of unknown function (DUF4082)